MQIARSKLPTLRTLLPALERAEQGGARLDLLIAYLVDAASSDDLRRIELFRADAYVPERIAALLGFVPQPYTTSLDAGVPGENIVLAMYSAARGRWAAIHRGPNGEEALHWGATEPLARRIAALHAIAAANGADDGAECHAPLAEFDAGFAEGRAAPPPGERDTALSAPGDQAPWKILF